MAKENTRKSRVIKFLNKQKESDDVDALYKKFIKLDGEKTTVYYYFFLLYMDWKTEK